MESLGCVSRGCYFLNWILRLELEGVGGGRREGRGRRWWDVGYINWIDRWEEENTPVRSDNSIPQRIHALGLRLMLYFRDAGSILLFLELASHLCGWR